MKLKQTLLAGRRRRGTAIGSNGLFHKSLTADSRNRGRQSLNIAHDLKPERHLSASEVVLYWAKFGKLAGVVGTVAPAETSIIIQGVRHEHYDCPRFVRRCPVPLAEINQFQATHGRFIQSDEIGRASC